jgi:hypothetical protein
VGPATGLADPDRRSPDDPAGTASNGRTIGEDVAMTFERVAWTVTVLVALLTAFLLLLAGYKGYAGVSAAVGAAAAINLF